MLEKFIEIIFTAAIEGIFLASGDGWVTSAPIKIQSGDKIVGLQREN